MEVRKREKTKTINFTLLGWGKRPYDMYGQPLFPDVSTATGPLTMEKIQTARRWGDMLQDVKEEEAYIVPQPEEEEEEMEAEQVPTTIAIEVEEAKTVSAPTTIKQPEKV